MRPVHDSAQHLFFLERFFLTSLWGSWISNVGFQWSHVLCSFKDGECMVCFHVWDLFPVFQCKTPQWGFSQQTREHCVWFTPLGFLVQHVRLFTLSDVCGSLQYMCHLGPTIISKLFLCRKNHGRFVPVAPWDFAETKPLHTSVFPGETRARCRKVVYKKNREKAGISRSGWKAQKGEGVTPFGFDIQTWAGKERRRQILSPVFFFSAMLVQHFFVHRSFTRWFLEDTLPIFIPPRPTYYCT